MYQTTPRILRHLLPPVMLQFALMLTVRNTGAGLWVFMLALLQPLPYGALVSGILHRPGRLKFLSFEDLRAFTAPSSRGVYLGTGFEFKPEHSQKLHEIMDEGLPAAGAGAHGSPALHALSRHNRRALTLALEDLKAHTLIFGTTGAGKTRMFELLSAQAVLRGDTVVVIDPKGDADLRDALKRACGSCGREDKFLEVDLAYPERSVRWDPLGNCDSVTEIGARITAQLSQNGSAASFRAHACNAVTAAAAALKIQGQRVTLSRIRNTLTSAAALQQAVKQRFKDISENVYNRNLMAHFENALKSEAKISMATLRSLYEMLLRAGVMESDPELEILMSVAAQDRAFFEKVSAGALPVLNPLCAGALHDLFSSRGGYTMGDVLDGAFVLYVSLRTLQDPFTGGTFGRLLLADLTASAGRIYARGQDSGQRSGGNVSVFIDEASEVMGESLVQLLNKSRGASFAVTLATQTVADLAARAGSHDTAMQILGNANNLIAMRLNDEETAKTVVSLMPSCRILDRSGSNGYREDRGTVGVGTVASGFAQREVALIPPQVLPRLPDFEYFARLADGRVVKGRIPLISREEPCC